MKIKKILKITFIISTIVFFGLLIILVLLSSSELSKVDAIVCFIAAILEILIIVAAWMLRNGYEKLIK